MCRNCKMPLRTCVWKFIHLQHHFSMKKSLQRTTICRKQRMSEINHCCKSLQPWAHWKPKHHYTFLKFLGQLYRNYKLPRSAEVNRVREALESSSMELQAVVKDPLPDALRLAEGISGMAGQSKSHDPVEVDHLEADLYVVDSAGVVQGNVCTVNNVHRPSLMERNSSARTLEWDSIHDSADHGDRLQLPSPRKLRVSPLNKYEIKTFKKRRKIRKWSPLEEETLRTGVEKYGKGNWKVILTVYHDIFEDRTEVDLKDKWRNLTRY